MGVYKNKNKNCFKIICLLQVFHKSFNVLMERSNFKVCFEKNVACLFHHNSFSLFFSVKSQQNQLIADL